MEKKQDEAEGFSPLLAENLRMRPADQAQIAFLLSEANREMEAYRARLLHFQGQRWILGPLLSLFAAPFVLLAALAFVFLAALLNPMLGVVALVGLAGGSVTLAANLFTRSERRYRALKNITVNHAALLRRLADSGEMQTIGLFMDTLDLQDGDARRLAEQTLTKLFLRLQPQEADRITDRHRQKLYQVLMTFADGNEAFCAAIIQVIAHIGNYDAIPVLENVAIRKASTPVRQQVIDAAKRMLPVLKERLQRAKTGETLLRASGPPAVFAETLLRPVASLPETEPQQLLRASIQETDNP